MTAKMLLRLVPLCALTMGSAATAQPIPESSIDPAKVLPHFNAETIDDTLKTVTGNHLAQIGEDGRTYVSAYSPQGLQFSIHFHQCEDTEQSKCGAIQLLTSWQVDGGAEQLDELVLSSAPNFLFVNVGRLPEGKPYMSRIVLAGEGISQGNLAREVELFLDAATRFGAEVRNPAP